MPPCRKICTGRLLPTPLPLAPVGGACCPAPAQLTCSCDDDAPEIACDEDTCANADDCKQLHPEICPHGLATDDDCTVCLPQPPARPELTLICPHCRSQISMFEDPKLVKNQSTMPQNYQPQPRKSWPVQKQASYPRSSPAFDPAAGGNDGHCDSNCPAKKSLEIQYKPSNSPAVSCCGSGSLKLRSPHMSQMKVPAGDDLSPQPPPPPPPDVAMSCCMSTNGIRTAPHMGRGSAFDSNACGGAGPKTCSEMGISEPEAPDPMPIRKSAVMGNMGPPLVQCKICMQAAAEPPEKCCPVSVRSQPQQKGNQNAARPARGSSAKGKEEQPPPAGPNPHCPRSGAGTLFPVTPQQACLCRMPPAYKSGCTGNLSGNCNCGTCNK